MSEATNQQAEAAPVDVVPEQVTDQDFNELFSANAEARGESQPQAETPQEEVTENAEAPPQEEDRIGALENTVKEMARVVVQNAQQQQAPQQQQVVQPEVPIEDRLASENPQDPEGVKWLVGQVKQVVSEELNKELNPLKQGLGYVHNQITQNQSEKVVQDFDQHVDAVMNNLQVDNDYDRNVMKDAVIQRGMKQYGQQFSRQHVPALLRNINNERLEARHQTSNSIDAEVSQNVQDTPPVQTGQTGKTAAQSLFSGLRDPKNKDLDFRGEGMTKTVLEYLGDAAAAVGKRTMG